MDVRIRLFTGFSLKNRSLLKNSRGVRHFTKPQLFFCPSPTQTLIFLETHTAQTIITFCAITFCVTFVYYILRQKLLHFALRMLLHFASKVTTFCVTITFCGKSYYILRYYYILCQLLQYVA